MQTHDEPGFINIGVGHDLTIKDLAIIVKNIVGFDGKIVYDLTKPDGTARKLMDVSKLHATGWKATIPLEAGISAVYAGLVNEEWY